MPTDVANAANQLREDIVLFNRRLRTKRAGHRLTASQLQALAHLDRVGPMSATALAALEGVTPQSIARTLGALDDADMVSRTADPADARATIITPTVHGRLMLTEDRAQRTEWLRRAIASELSDAERDVLFIAGGLLRRLAESADPAAVDPGTPDLPALDPAAFDATHSAVAP